MILTSTGPALTVVDAGVTESDALCTFALVLALKSLIENECMLR